MKALPRQMILDRRPPWRPRWLCQGVPFVLIVLGYLSILGGSVTFTTFRFANPELTEPQAFTAFWPLHCVPVAGVALVAVGYLFLKGGR